jgi:hypothetical protein
MNMAAELKPTPLLSSDFTNQTGNDGNNHQTSENPRYIPRR